MDSHELIAIVKELNKLEEKLFTKEPVGDKPNYCMTRCKELYCHSYGKCMKCEVGLICEIYRLKGILRDVQSNVK